MSFRRVWLFVALSGSLMPIAQAQLGPPMSATGRGPTRIYTDATQETGTILRQDLKWTSPIPLDKTYEQLTPKELKEFRSMYYRLPESEEPPFPVEGMTPIYKALKEGQHILQARGELNMVVTVDFDGEAVKVEDMGGVHDIQMTELAQQVLLLTRYKPAKCGGIPCRMVFPFKLKLKGS